MPDVVLRAILLCPAHRVEVRRGDEVIAAARPGDDGTVSLRVPVDAGADLRDALLRDAPDVLGWFDGVRSEELREALVEDGIGPGTDPAATAAHVVLRDELELAASTDAPNVATLAALDATGSILAAKRLWLAPSLGEVEDELGGEDVAADLPGGYEAMGAEAKQHELWQRLQVGYCEARKRKSPRTWLGTGLVSDVTRKLGRALKTGDALSSRRKLVHQFGVVGPFSFEPDPSSPYSGMLSERCVGVLRLSHAFNVDWALAPGAALKFLVDGRPSRNLALLHTGHGQGGDTNFFRHPLRSHVPPVPPTGPTARERVLFWGLRRTEKRGTKILHARHRGAFRTFPMTHLATTQADGGVPDDPLAPGRIHAIATDRARDELDAAVPSSSESRAIFGVLERLSQLTPGPLFDLLGFELNAVGEVIAQRPIGTIALTAPLVASPWGDEHLHFAHDYPKA